MNKVEILLHTIHKINSKWVNNLNIIIETMKTNRRKHRYLNLGRLGKENAGLECKSIIGKGGVLNWSGYL
jgi:hypothetical protein